MLPRAATLLLLATAVCSQNAADYSKIDLGDIPTPKERMAVQLQNDASLNYGNEIPKDTLYGQPRVYYLVNDNDYYAYAGLLLAGADDERCPGKQTLLSLKINIEGSKVDKTGNEVSPYEFPKVDKKTALLYVAMKQIGKTKQDAILPVPELLDSLLERRECISFVDDFMKPNGITQVYAGNYGFVLPKESEPEYS